MVMIEKKLCWFSLGKGNKIFFCVRNWSRLLPLNCKKLLMMPLHYHPVTKSVEVLPLCCDVKKKKGFLWPRNILFLLFICFHVILRIFFLEKLPQSKEGFECSTSKEENTSIHVPCITKEWVKLNNNYYYYDGDTLKERKYLRTKPRNDLKWFQRYKIVLEICLIQTKRLKTVNFSWLTENFKKCKITIIKIIVIITVFSGV